MSRLEAIIFDMDGVVLDSREFIHQAFENVLTARGVETTRQQMAAVTGKPIRAMYELLAPQHDAAELETAHIEHHDAHLHLLQAYEGGREVLTQLRDAGYRIGMFTGSYTAMALDRLQRFELEEFFEVIIGADKCSEHKPSPDGLLRCLGELSCAPADAIYIGDGIGDMLAGKASGVRATIGITHGMSSKDELQQHNPDYIIDSLTELPALLPQIEQ